jgi:hypothetical protein
MRVAVVTSPRTGSTFCLKLISNLLGLKNYEEILNELVYVFPDGSYILVNTNRTDKSVLDKLTNTDDYVVKIIASELFERNLGVDHFPWDMFDTIILLERDNIFEQIVSWYNLDYWQKSIKKETTYKTYYMKDKFIEFAVDCIKKYHIVKDVIRENTNKSIVVKKENIVNDISKIFDKQVTEDITANARKLLVPECDINSMDYDVVMRSQNIKERVLTVLEKELKWNE